MRLAAGLIMLAWSGTSAFAVVDVAHLPDTCKTTIAAIKSDNAKIAEFGRVMAKAKKAQDNANFCSAAKQTLALVADDGAQIERCLGELAVDKTVSQDTVGQFTEIKNYYRKMLDAAKEPANDHMHCGLAD
ncbi:hypothetical protein [Lichenifustis flavocetrariae]|uniref:Uncharacterized protein n=1 Tax=Lichenifustis flavocetrariae TaxID=2949735 RepID=A0AA41Z076_9HYPH|nr:hypothetical protein [Lichenifustis flavocetrariae]MCW6510363.1 hypothetical protein [Lichenifustis flavocetrariae]